MPAQGQDQFYTSATQVQGQDRYPGPTTSLPGQDRYRYPQPLKEEEVVLDDGEIGEEGEVSDRPVPDDDMQKDSSVSGDPSAVLWRCCGCRWAHCTTYKGPCIHQAQGRCGWHSESARIWRRRAVRHTPRKGPWREYVWLVACVSRLTWPESD